MLRIKGEQALECVHPVFVIERLETRALLSAAPTPAASLFPASSGTVDLSETVTIDSSSATVQATKDLKFAVVVTNGGTGTASGNLVTDIGASSSSSGTSPASIGTVHSQIHLKAGASVTLKYKVNIGSSLAIGDSYYLTTDVDPSNKFHETNTNNNFAVSGTEFTVEPLVPDLDGESFSGSGDVVRGPDRGTTGQLEVSVSSETAKGVLSGTGVFNYASTANYFTFTGRVRKNNIVTLKLQSNINNRVTPFRAKLSDVTTLTGTCSLSGDQVKFTITD